MEYREQGANSIIDGDDDDGSGSGGGRDDVQNDQRNSKAFLGYRDRERKKSTS